MWYEAMLHFGLHRSIVSRAPKIACSSAPSISILMRSTVNMSLHSQKSSIAVYWSAFFSPSAAIFRYIHHSRIDIVIRYTFSVVSVVGNCLLNSRHVFDSIASDIALGSLKSNGLKAKTLPFLPTFSENKSAAVPTQAKRQTQHFHKWVGPWNLRNRTNEWFI